MELSTTANWLGVITGCVLGASWVWKLQLWLRKELLSTREGVALGAKLASMLLNNATSPARRADIHSYIQFRCTEIEASHTRQLLMSLMMGAMLALSGVGLSVINRVLDVDAIQWLWLLAITTYAGALITFVMALFSSNRIRQLEAGWQKQAGSLLANRAFRHLPDGE